MAGQIVRDGATGQAIVASTGTPVDSILEALQNGDSRADVLRAHPGLALEDIDAALRFARAAVERGVTYRRDPNASQAGSMTVREPVAVWASPRPRATARKHPNVQSALRSAERERERAAYRLDLIEGIRDGLAQAAAGDVIPHEEVFARLCALFPG